MKKTLQLTFGFVGYMSTAQLPFGKILPTKQWLIGGFVNNLFVEFVEVITMEHCNEIAALYANQTSQVFNNM